MTDYQARVQQLRDRITPDSSRDDLILIHTHLMSIAPHIWLGARWGDYTTYTTRVREPDAVAMTDGKIQTLPGGLGKYRIEMGANANGETHARLECWEPAPLYQWEPWDDPAVTERVWAWLRKYQPAAEVLMEIDTRLLREGQ